MAESNTPWLQYRFAGTDAADKILKTIPDCFVFLHLHVNVTKGLGHLSIIDYEIWQWGRWKSFKKITSHDKYGTHVKYGKIL